MPYFRFPNSSSFQSLEGTTVWKKKIILDNLDDYC